jgi:nitrate/nitrite transporter NarK
VSAIALLLCAALIFSARFVDHSLMAVLVISAGMFCAAAANPCVGALIISMGGRHVATLSAANNMCGNLGAAAFPIVVPWLLHHAGGWNVVLGGFGALYIIAAIFWLLIRSTGKELAN